MNTSTPSAVDCPQCGEPTEALYEGYCQNCCEENQRELDAHNARFDWWEGLSDKERYEQIRQAIALAGGE